VPPEPEVVESEPDVPDPFFVVEPLVVVVLVVVAAGAAFATVLAATFAIAGTTFVTLGTDVADLVFGRGPSPIGEAAGSTRSVEGRAPLRAPPEIPLRVRVSDRDAGPVAEVLRVDTRAGVRFCFAADSGPAPAPELASVPVAAVETPPDRAATAPTEATHLTSMARRLFNSARRCISPVMRRCRPAAVLRRCLLAPGLLAGCLLTGCGR
jgi:hypothetical protein